MQPSDTTSFLHHTTLLDYESIVIQHLIHQRGWKNLSSASEKIAAAYHFVKDEILFGFSPSFQGPASKVLKQGVGSNLDKTILVMALLRALDIPCRLQADMVDKVVHRGLLDWLSYKLCPSELYHNAVQLLYNNRWLTVEGYGIDGAYLSELQAQFPDYSGSFYGYGIAVLNFRNPDTRWDEGETSIQGKAVVRELGPYNDPDAFYAAHPEAQQRTQSLCYKKLIRLRLNKRIAALRGNRTPLASGFVEPRLQELSDLKRS